MAVVHCEEVVNRDGERDDTANVRYRRTWQVVCDTPQDGANTVLAHNELPAFGDFYEYTNDSTGLPVLEQDLDAVCVRIRASQDDPENLANWSVVAEYMGFDEPEAQPAEVDYSPTKYQEHAVDDIHGNPIVNAAGDQFEGVMRDRTRFTLTIVQNLTDADWNASDALDYQDSLNENIFLAAAEPPGFAPGTCKITVSAKRVRKRGLNAFYWIRTAVIEIDKNGWKSKPRNAGYRYLVFGETPQKKRVYIDPETGAKPPNPILLDDDGGILPEGGVPNIAGPGGEGFDVYETKDWGPLNLEY